MFDLEVSDVTGVWCKSCLMYTVLYVKVVWCNMFFGVKGVYFKRCLVQKVSDVKRFLCTHCLV